MSPELDKRIPAALLILRFFLAIFLLQWSIENLILPDAAVASGHATLATKRTLLLNLGRTCTGWIAPALPGAFTHSITSSAMASSPGGMVRPSACAVIRFTTRSNLVGCCTGKSLTFVPRRMRSTYVAALWRTNW
jgi:hypothetical protein